MSKLKLFIFEEGGGDGGVAEQIGGPASHIKFFLSSAFRLRAVEFVPGPRNVPGTV